MEQFKVIIGIAKISLAVRFVTHFDQKYLGSSPSWPSSVYLAITVEVRSPVSVRKEREREVFTEQCACWLTKRGNAK